MRFILIGNYPPDRQESMKKYTLNLCENIIQNGVEAEVWYPTVFFGAGSNNTTSGIAKWLGYIDKWILFPLILRMKVLFKRDSANHRTIYHVCDHSNSPYLQSLPKDRSGITCHDVLAIRGALGYKDAYCPATSTGKILQKWILKNLKKAKVLTAVSELTMGQLKDLYGKTLPEDYKWKVIHNSFNAHFWPMEVSARTEMIAAAGIPVNMPFVLHVGSSLPRKNRKMLLDMVDQLGQNWQGLICFAGQPINEELKLKAESLGLTDRVISVVKPEHGMLVALYSACEVFVFPSYSEGFGWPLIEAQACGTPVLASDVDPMPEVSNGSAIHANPDDARAFANALQEILIPARRAEMVAAGFLNAARFDSRVLAKDFINLYMN